MTYRFVQKNLPLWLVKLAACVTVILMYPFIW
jgi:hypothetical protein